MSTPYGGRICYVLPNGNHLYIHLKDKLRIRHKKRWSQVMYLYYLLGWKLTRKYLIRQDSEDHKILEQQLKKEKQNTYILALDGDMNFQPSALMLLIDRLRMYPTVGAACGRIHPTGFGPTVWFQKFEYAVCHWFQKTAEHVFGCVLCSPGCFSLFRGAALMDDNVMKKYATKATEAAQYVQYDQGEDRWLCTLLLQQGWRIEYTASSDSYTNAPQEFKEFYNQRRRWGPSSLANTLDLLNTGKETSRKNSSISRLYILYQILQTAFSILAPATVCLMIAGCFTFIFGLNGNISLFLAVLPPVFYMVICFTCKSDNQILVAGFMSIFYAFLMAATFLSIIVDMVKQQTFITPSGLFFIFLVVLYFVAALMHPQEFHLVLYGFIYIICVPSAYLLLNIYTLVNLNNISWGTRETATYEKLGTRKAKKYVKYEKKCKCLCWNLEFQVNEDQKISASSNPEEVVLLNDASESQNEETENFEAGAIDDTVDERWIQQLQENTDHIELVEDKLDEDEIPFWKGLIHYYLEPLKEDKQKQSEIIKDLRNLRNKATFVFFFINCLWIVCTFFLQLIGSGVSINLPKISVDGETVKDAEIHIDAIGLVILLGFAGLLMVQFVSMIYHRIYTLIHRMAYIGSASKESEKKPLLKSKAEPWDPEMIPEPEKNIQKKRKSFDGQLEYSGINCHGMD
ncbi:chitin synthase chs-1-like [Acipenser ruthenus]|nr:chitin synthase chs-1-like [Acipenser ruthenus]